MSLLYVKVWISGIDYGFLNGACGWYTFNVWCHLYVYYERKNFKKKNELQRLLIGQNDWRVCSFKTPHCNLLDWGIYTFINPFEIKPKVTNVHMIVKSFVVLTLESDFTNFCITCDSMQIRRSVGGLHII